MEANTTNQISQKQYSNSKLMINRNAWLVGCNLVRFDFPASHHMLATKFNAVLGHDLYGSLMLILYDQYFVPVHARAKLSGSIMSF